MKINRNAYWAMGALLALSVAACSNDNDANQDAAGGAVIVPDAPAPAGVPASAGVSVGAFVSYLMSLSGSDETSEPLVISDTFAVPADETSEPQPLV
jgi:hypothetical protein